MTWVQIQKEYPHMYVGLDDVELVEDGHGVKSGIVNWAAKTPPGCKVIDWGCYTYSPPPPPGWIFYTMLDEDHPLGYLNPNTKKTGGERLSWAEIVRRYPHQNVGIVEIEFGINAADVKSAVVKYTSKDTSYDEMCLAALRNEIWMCYTTRDEDFLVIGPQVLPWEDSK